MMYIKSKLYYLILEMLFWNLGKLVNNTKAEDSSQGTANFPCQVYVGGQGQTATFHNLKYFGQRVV